MTSFEEAAAPTWAVTAEGTSDGVTKVTLTADLVDPSVNPVETLKSWGFPPLVGDPDVKQALATISHKLEEIMALVKVEQADLDALDGALDEVAASLADKIASLALPDADLAALNADVDALRALAAPAPVVEPPV